jgi:transposase
VVTDTLGLLLAVVVTAVSVSDTAAGKDLLDVVAVEHPAVSTVWVDGGYQAAAWRRGAQQGIDVEVVTRSPKGFRVLPRRWVVERTFGWLMQHRRLSTSALRRALRRSDPTVLAGALNGGDPHHRWHPSRKSNASVLNVIKVEGTPRLSAGSASTTSRHASAAAHATPPTPVLAHT